MRSDSNITPRDIGVRIEIDLRVCFRCRNREEDQPCSHNEFIQNRLTAQFGDIDVCTAELGLEKRITQTVCGDSNVTTAYRCVIQIDCRRGVDKKNEVGQKGFCILPCRQQNVARFVCRIARRCK